MPYGKYMEKWLKDPKGGGAWSDIRSKLDAHNPDCESLDRAWLPRIGGVSDLALYECDDCQLTMHPEGVRLYEAQVCGSLEELELCDCCYKQRIAEDVAQCKTYDQHVSRRFFLWKRGTYDVPWWQMYMTGHEENCNRTVGFRTAWGFVFVCLNMPLRQKPCTKDMP